MTKINKEYLRQFTGSLANAFPNIIGDKKVIKLFEILNKNRDEEIDLEEITDFTSKLWAFNENFDDKIDDNELKNFLQANKDTFGQYEIGVKDIKKFLKLYKECQTEEPENYREDHEDGSYSLYFTKIGYKKINYSADNEIISTEQREGNLTKVLSPSNELLKEISHKNNGVDVVTEFSTDEAGNKVETSYYTNNEGKIGTPVKTIHYQDGFSSKFEYNTAGEIVSRTDYYEKMLIQQTLYENNEEVKTTQLYITGGITDDPQYIADGIIDNVEQNGTGDCYLLQGLQALSHTPAGRQAIKDAVCINPENGEITVKFKHAYGETKEFTFTKEELEEAREKEFLSYDLQIKKGTLVYVDGKKFSGIDKNADTFSIDANQVSKDITLETPEGDTRVWSKQELEENAKYTLPKYSSGDLDTLAIELAVEKSRAEVGIPLDGGNFSEVGALFFDDSKCRTLWNPELNEKISANEDATKYDNALKGLMSFIDRQFEETSKQGMTAEIMELKNKLGTIPNQIALTVPNEHGTYGLHAGEILRFETENDKTYIVYTHSWDTKAEIKEELNDFVNKLYYIKYINPEELPQDSAEINADSELGVFSGNKKTNKTNFSAVINMFSQNPGFNQMLTDRISHDESGNISIQLGQDNKLITVSANDINTAKASGRYSTGDDDITAIEIALGRYINNLNHNNTLTVLAHTDLETVSIDSIINILSGGKLHNSIQHDFAAIKNQLETGNSLIASAQKGEGPYIFIKKVEENPDGTFNFIFIPDEDSSSEITMNYDDFKRNFPYINVVSKKA